jgi:hypothetical protein
MKTVNLQMKRDSIWLIFSNLQGGAGNIGTRKHQTLPFAALRYRSGSIVWVSVVRRLRRFLILWLPSTFS